MERMTTLLMPEQACMQPKILIKSIFLLDISDFFNFISLAEENLFYIIWVKNGSVEMKTLKSYNNFGTELCEVLKNDE